MKVFKSEINGIKFYHREGMSDLKTFNEVIGNETYLKKALTIIGVDFTNRISTISRERKIGFSRAQKMTISDNFKQDRIDMWADPIKN